jgi:hypothetical protein
VREERPASEGGPYWKLGIGFRTVAGWTPSGIIEETTIQDVLFRSLAPMTERNPGLTNR